MYVDPREELPPVPGDIVAHALIATYRCICDPARWTSDAYARDREGQPLRNLRDFKTRGRSYSLLGALDRATDDVDVQAAACSALKRVRDAAGLHVSLMSLGDAEGHRRLLELGGSDPAGQNAGVAAQRPVGSP